MRCGGAGGRGRRLHTRAVCSCIECLHIVRTARRFPRYFSQCSADFPLLLGLDSTPGRSPLVYLNTARPRHVCASTGRARAQADRQRWEQTRGGFQRNTVGQVTASIACLPQPPTRQFKVARQHPNPNSLARRKLGYESQCNTDRARSESGDCVSPPKHLALMSLPLSLPTRSCSRAGVVHLLLGSLHRRHYAPHFDIVARFPAQMYARTPCRLPVNFSTSSGVAAQETRG